MCNARDCNSRRHHMRGQIDCWRDRCSALQRWKPAAKHDFLESKQRWYPKIFFSVLLLFFFAKKVLPQRKKHFKWLCKSASLWICCRFYLSSPSLLFLHKDQSYVFNPKFCHRTSLNSQSQLSSSIVVKKILSWLKNCGPIWVKQSWLQNK